MPEERSYFFRPQIFFGSFQQQEEGMQSEWDLSDPWRVFLNADLSVRVQPRVELFIDWSEGEDDS